MYDLPYHKESNDSVVKDFVETYPFAFLVGCNAQNIPVATQVPLFLEEKDGRKTLSGHIMRNTDHHQAFQRNPNVLAVFTGKHCYVSGTWYANPYMASTWNYMSVHAKGTIRFLEDEALEDMLRKTSLHFEKNNPKSTTVFDNLSPEFTRKAMKWIVAFEIDVHQTDNVFKLSQDRDEKSYRNIIEKLHQQGADEQAIAVEMEKRVDQVFPGKNNMTPPA